METTLGRYKRTGSERTPLGDANVPELVAKTRQGDDTALRRALPSFRGTRLDDLLQFVEAAERWSPARKLIQGELRTTPDSHWPWMILGETYYEQREYEPALKFAKKSLALAPNCPMVLWHYAGTLAMLGRYKRALAASRKIMDREVESVAYGGCGEGLDWAMQLMNDCHFRMGRCHLYLGDKKAAQVSFRKYAHNRSHGVESIYDLKKAESLLAESSK